MSAFENLPSLNQQLINCRLCPRLVAWREQVAQEKRASFAAWDYWGRPVPGFGDPNARLLIVGLAPAAHGANRTGRMFTGDRSGEWLFRALHDAGFANQAQSISNDDELKLNDAYITAIVRCAPPDNKPTPIERHNCNTWLLNELALLPQVKVIMALGQMAFQQLLAMATTQTWNISKPPIKFSHGVEVQLIPHHLTMIASFHPSQQNTFTKRLTQPMFDAIFHRARELIA